MKIWACSFDRMVESIRFESEVDSTRSVELAGRCDIICFIEVPGDVLDERVEEKTGV
jgi:hypothetical protein